MSLSTSEDSVSASQFFLRYAFPCAYVLCDHGRLSAQEYDFLQHAAVHGVDVPFEKLEVFFPEAFRRIRVTAKKRDLDPFSLPAIRAYFREDHNTIIDEGDGMYAKMPKEFCDFCKVKELVVLEKKLVDDKLFLRIGKQRWVQAPFFSPVGVRVGDIVTVHHALAVELLR